MGLGALRRHYPYRAEDQVKVEQPPAPPVQVPAPEPEKKVAPKKKSE